MHQVNVGWRCVGQRPRACAYADPEPRPGEATDGAAGLPRRDQAHQD